MKMIYDLKIALYNFFATKPGRYFLKCFANLIYVKSLKKSKSPKNKKFLVAITIDTESGYVKDDNSRVWQISDPTAYVGYYKGAENWRNLLNKYGAKGTFFLSTNCFDKSSKDYRKIIHELELLKKERHEIGLHMHPDSDLVLQNELKKKFNATSARFYDKNELDAMVLASRRILKQHIKIDAKSIRWGNWALDTNAVRILDKLNFKIDSSATPGIKGHQNDTMHYDWSKVKERYPWKLSGKNYQNTKNGDTEVLEIPIATFNILGMTLRADPVYSLLLNSAFDYYYKNADRSQKPFVFVVISHSSEGTHKDGTKTRVIDDTEEFIRHARKFNDVEFATIKKSYEMIK